MLSTLIDKNSVPDIRAISRRYGAGGIVTKSLTVDGISYRFECTSIDAIDQYLQTECRELLNRSEMAMVLDLISYEDGVLVRDDLAALDSLLVQMIETGLDCTTLQGANCG